MFGSFQAHVAHQLADIRSAGTYKNERVIVTPQGTTIRVADGQPVLNFCANNYLGLAQHPEVKAAARAALDEWGYGMASVRFICGTQSVHKQLEAKLSEFLGTEDTILYSSCFDANGGLFETLLNEHDAIISDALNHASIIDGIRLCRAHRQRYANNSMEDLEAKLKAAERRALPDGRHRRRVLDGRLDRQPARRLRSRGDVRRAGHGGRFARGRLHGPARPRHARAPRRDGPRGHPHGHARQGARRRQRRLHERPARDHRIAPAAVAPVPVLEHAVPQHRRRHAEGARDAHRVDRSCATRWRRTRGSSARAWRPSATRCCRARTRSARS